MAVVRNGNAPALIEVWRPLVWSAIVGGTVTALGIQLIFTLLGVGIGAALAGRYASGDAGDGMGAGAVAWLFISGVASFGIGGWVAGMMSGVIRTGGGALHGVVSWALAAVFGATVATMAGAAISSGAAAGAGAMGGGTMSGLASGNTTAPFSIIMRSGAAATGAPLPSAATTASPSASPTTTSAGSRTAASGTPGTTLVNRYGQEITEAEARAMADEASRAAAKASLWTAAAFFVSMIVAGVGGMLGRRGHVKYLPAGSWGGTPATV